MKNFKINDRIEIECEWKKTRTAFKHIAVLTLNGRKVEETKICYVNRTWESYEFQSVMRKLIYKTKALTEDEKALSLKFIEDYKETGVFNSLLAMAKMGDIFCSTPKESNEWKVRMMKASLGKLIDLPEDWGNLPEEEKTKRLNGALDVLK